MSLRIVKVEVEGVDYDSKPFEREYYIVQAHRRKWWGKKYWTRAPMLRLGRGGGHGNKCFSLEEAHNIKFKTLEEAHDNLWRYREGDKRVKKTVVWSEVPLYLNGLIDVPVPPMPRVKPPKSDADISEVTYDR